MSKILVDILNITKVNNKDAYEASVSLGGATHALTFNPRVKGEPEGSYIAKFPSSLASIEGVATNKTLPLADLLKGSLASVDITEGVKGSRGPRTTTTPLAIHCYDYILKNGLYFIEANVGGHIDLLPISAEEQPLVANYMLVKNALNYYSNETLGVGTSTAYALGLKNLETFKNLAGITPDILKAMRTALDDQFNLPSLTEASALYLAPKVDKGEADADPVDPVDPVDPITD